MMENYLKLLAIGDCIRKWGNGTAPPRAGIDRMFMLLMSGMACVFFGDGASKGYNYVFFGLAALHLAYPIYWLFKPKSKWDDELSRLIECYQPVDLASFVELKKAILKYDTLRLEDAESWLIKEISANQGIADVVGSKAGGKYKFLYDEPIAGKGGENLEGK